MWVVDKAAVNASGTQYTTGYVAAVAATYKCIQGDTAGTVAYEAWKYLAVETEDAWRILIKILENEATATPYFEAGSPAWSTEFWATATVTSTSGNQAITATYNGGTKGQTCGTGTNHGTGAVNTLEAKTSTTPAACATACNALKPWKIGGANNLASEANDNTYCLGYEITAYTSPNGTCKGFKAAEVTATGGDGSKDAAETCYIRRAVA
jgi:hypothetical protein